MAIRLTSLLALASLPVFSCACAPGELRVLVPDLPNEVDLVTVLFESDTAGVVGSTGLSPPEEVLALEIELDVDLVDRALVFAYLRADLQTRVSPPSDEVLERGRTRRAGADDPVLPPPSYFGVGPRSGDEVLALSALGTEPELSVDWLPPCPELVPPSEQYLFDLHCAPPCPAIVEQAACQLQITARDCGLTGARIDLDARGRFRLPDQDASPCAPSLDRTEPYECRINQQRCALSFLPPGDELGEPNLELYSQTGGTTGMAVLEDRVILGIGADNESCSETAPYWAAQTFDLETLELIDTSTIAECTTALAAHPSGEGYLVASGPPGQQRWVHRSPSGEILGEGSIPQPAANGLVVANIQPVGSSVALHMVATFDIVQYSSWVVVLNPDRPDLPPVIQGPLDRGVVWLAPSSQGKLLIAEDGPTNLTIVDPRTGGFEFFSISNLCHVFNLGLSSIIESSPQRISIGTGESNRTGLLHLDRVGDGFDCHFASHLEPGGGSATGRVPFEPSRQLLGVQDNADGSGKLAVYDSDLDRFLVGTRPTGGRGRLVEVAPDRHGRAWLRYQGGDLVRFDGFQP